VQQQGRTMDRKTVDSGSEPNIDAELAILAAIENRFSEELAKLERLPKPPDDKERLRQQLDAGRKMAREPHVLRLAALHEQMQMRMLFGVQTKH
jgi:hypothetical protein